MSSLKRNLFLSVFGAAMSATVAFAADLPAPPVIEYEPETPVEIGSSWYLRGDLGFSVYQGGDASWVDAFHNTRNFTDMSIENGWVAGIGAGYYFNEHFRADVTLDYRHDVEHDGKAVCPNPTCTPATTTRERVNFSAWTLMANGYVDFGTYSSITPYVGAGIGVAWLNVNDYSSSGSGGFIFRDNTQTNFAWNVMAGAAFDIADNVKLDANYRFVSLGEAETKGPTTGSANPVKYEDLYAHDFRLGLRYDLN